MNVKDVTVSISPAWDIEKNLESCSKSLFTGLRSGGSWNANGFKFERRSRIRFGTCALRLCFLRALFPVSDVKLRL